MIGKQIRKVPLINPTVDISDLQSRIFVVNIFKEGERVFNSKLIVKQSTFISLLNLETIGESFYYEK